MFKEENKAEMELWAEERKKHDLKYPDNYVVRYLHKNFLSGEGKRILDFACGSGRNTLVMAEMQFDIYAVDYNDICLELTREKMEKINYHNIIYLKNTRTDIPVEDGILDCIVAWGALYYCNEADRNLLFDEINRVLKEDALFLGEFRTKDDFLYKKGLEIEKDYFVLDNVAGVLAGINYWFCDEEELRRLYWEHGFEIVNLEKREFYTDNMSKNVSHYHVWAKKKGDRDERFYEDV